MLLNRAAQFEKLHLCIKDAFPDYKIIVNSRNKNRHGFIKPELDFWIPKLKLGFEFLEDTTTSKNHLDLSSYVRGLGVTLISIPVWWNSSEDELKSTLSFYRPDMIFQHASELDPVPLNPPPLIPNPTVIPVIGDFMFPKPETISSFCESLLHSSPSWWMSEKYESIRCFWYPASQRLYGKHKVTLPRQYMKAMSKFTSPLDGEIWFGRDLEEPVHNLTHVLNWFQPLRFIVRDLVASTSSEFPKTYSKLLSAISSNHSFVIAPAMQLTKQIEGITFFLQNIIEKDGMGILLRKPKSYYISGESSNLFEITVCDVQLDAIAISKTRKKCTVMLPFEVEPVTFKNESGLIKPGDILRLQIDNFTLKDVQSTNPILLQIENILWDDAIRSIVNNEQQRQNTATMEEKKKQAYLRKVLVDFARKRKLDPLNPETWYCASSLPNKIKKEQLPMLFPEIGLEDMKFTKIRKHYWEDENNRRKFYIDFANEKGFDPLVPHNWYSISNQDIKNAKGLSVLRYHKNNHSTAISELFCNANL